MRILLVNDDGIFAAGIRALAEELQSKYDVFIVAPDAERSGCSHHFTMAVPLRVKKVTLHGMEHIHSFSVNGTPVDCVKLGVGNLKANPDIVISGINLGANLGTDTFYSGTVAAAMEGVFLHKPSIALSIDSFEPKHMETALKAARDCIELLLSQKKPILINVNVPDIPISDVKGIKFTALNHINYGNEYIERLDPRDAKYYWTPFERISVSRPDADTDERWVKEGYVSVTPLLTDLTDYETLSHMKNDKGG